MKLALIAIALTAAAASAQAGPNSQMGTSNAYLSSKDAGSAEMIQTGGRKGSKRVGGTGRSGKGGHYVGGRRS